MGTLLTGKGTVMPLGKGGSPSLSTTWLPMIPSSMSNSQPGWGSSGGSSRGSRWKYGHSKLRIRRSIPQGPVASAKPAGPAAEATRAVDWAPSDRLHRQPADPARPWAVVPSPGAGASRSKRPIPARDVSNESWRFPHSPWLPPGTIEPTGLGRGRGSGIGTGSYAGAGLSLRTGTMVPSPGDSAQG